MKKLILKTEKNLIEIEKAMIETIKNIGSTEASKKTGLTISYLSDVLHGRKVPGTQKMLKIAKLIL